MTVDEAKTELRYLQNAKSSLRNTERYIREKMADMAVVRGYATDSTPVMGGGNKYEEHLCITIDKLSDLREEAAKQKAHIDAVERALSRLTESEYTLLNRMLVNRQSGAWVRAMMDYAVSKTVLYQMINSAVERYIVFKEGEGK